MPLLLLPRGVKNLAGRTFGELTPLSIARIVPGGGALWSCSCSCGGPREALASALVRGDVTRCAACARSRRVSYLHEAKRRSLLTRGDSNSDYQRNWRAYVARMTTGQRAEFDRMIASRRRLGAGITDAVRAGVVEVVMLEARAA